MSKLRSLIIDDEPNARMRLRRLLSDDDRVEVIGEAKDGLEAVTEIQRLTPDLVFLDVQMP
ncbi:MAG TPA: response regulator, partial [Chthoniobacterales bacterium]